MSNNSDPCTQNATADPRTLVIVGGVAGGASAACRARRCNEAAEIIMFEKDQHVSFANCGLPYYIGGEIERREALLVASPELFQERFRVDVRVRQEVTAVDREQKCVEVRNLETGATYTQPYDRLILAMGAAPIVPPIEGAGAENVFTLRNLDDADHIKSWIERCKPAQAAIVGAGFIGLEMAEQLHGLGMQVSVVELIDQVLPPLDREMAALVENELVQHGVELHLGDGIAKVRCDGDRATGVVLASGKTVDAEIVVLGVGVRPNVRLALEAGLELGAAGGIRVNEFMQTSDQHVYAVGDAVEYACQPFDVPQRVPLAGPANRAGRIAGQHAASDHARPMAPVAGTAIVRVFGLAAGTTGIGKKQAQWHGMACRSAIVHAAQHASYFPGAKNIVLKLMYEPESGRILGAQAVGADGVDKRIDVIATAIRFGGTVHDLAGVDLCYAPPYGSAKDIVHMAAFAAENDLDQLTPLVAADADLPDGSTIVDVRSAKEVAALRITDAVHIPIDELRNRLGEIPSGRPVVALCHSGKRAHVAARLLAQSGFPDVSNCSGGISMRRLTRPDEVSPRPDKPEA